MNNNNIIEVRQNLLRALESLDASSPTTSSPSTAVPTQSTQAIMAPTTAAAAAAAEQRRLFSFGRPARTSNQTGKGKSKGKRPPTCTIKFVCLASKDATKPPQVLEKKLHFVTVVWGMGVSHSTLDQGGGASDDQRPPPIELADIADITLRNLISELDSLPNDEDHTQDARLSLEPYLYEAGLDPDNLYGNRKLVLEGLMVYHVIDKRRLDELAQGMEEVSLITYLRRTPSLIKAVFPNEAEKVILAEEVKELLTFEDRNSNEKNERTAEFFGVYIDELERETRGEDGYQMVTLVHFWTGADTLPKDSLRVKFDDGSNVLPLAETCFRTIVLPTKHTNYDDFKKNMDIALKFGSRGFSFA
ncbi:uncharacterized protein LOC144648453 [Oculina patagonica]